MGSWKPLSRAIACTLIIAGCATPFDRGLDAFRRGDCKTAYQDWRKGAQAGDAASIHNVGVILERGCPAANLRADPKSAFSWFDSGARAGNPLSYVALGHYYRAGLYVPRDEQKAIAHYHYAARWGRPEAVKALAEMGVVAPQADLLAQAQERQRVQQQQAVDTAVLIGASILEGAAQGYMDGLNAPPPAYSAPAMTPRAAQVVVRDGCTSDYSCGMGRVCVKPLYQSTGVCLQAVNSLGTPALQLPRPSSIGPRGRANCQFTTDCPIGFACDPELKACVK